MARTTVRNHHRPLPGALPSGVICLFIFLGLAVAIQGSAGAGLESRYVTIYLPWCFVLLLGWALRVGDQDTRAPWGAGWADWASRMTSLTFPVGTRV